jgi:hypothetical protein
MKYYKRLNVWKARNVKFNPETIEAWSYGWWLFVCVIKGKVVFNRYHYSKTTSKHQDKVSWLLSQLGIKVDVEVSMHGSLRSFERCALTPVYREIETLKLEMTLKGARKAKNKERAKRIKHLQRHVQTLRFLGAKCSLKQQRDIRQAVIETFKLKRARKSLVRVAELVSQRPTLALVQGGVK